jgi:hypothetical protein
MSVTVGRMSEAVPQTVATVKGRWRGRARGGILLDVTDSKRGTGGLGASQQRKAQYWQRAGKRWAYARAKHWRCHVDLPSVVLARKGYSSTSSTVHQLGSSSSSFSVAITPRSCRLVIQRYSLTCTLVRWLSKRP